MLFYYYYFEIFFFGLFNARFHNAHFLRGAIKLISHSRRIPQNLYGRIDRVRSCRDLQSSNLFVHPIHRAQSSSILSFRCTNVYPMLCSIGNRVFHRLYRYPVANLANKNVRSKRKLTCKTSQVNRKFSIC